LRSGKKSFFTFTSVANPNWPKNLEEAIEWQDDVDAKEYLMELLEMDKKGAMKFAKSRTV